MGRTVRFQKREKAVVTSTQDFVNEVKRLTGIELVLDTSVPSRGQQDLSYIRIAPTKGTLAWPHFDGQIAVTAETPRQAETALWSTISDYLRTLAALKASGDRKATLSRVRVVRP